MRRHPIAGVGASVDLLLPTITSSLRGECVRAASTFGASPGGLTLQTVVLVVDDEHRDHDRAQVGIEQGLTGAARPSDRRGENRAPDIFEQRCAAALTAAVEPWLAAISQTGRSACARPKSIALLIASA